MLLTRRAEYQADNYLGQNCVDILWLSLKNARVSSILHNQKYTWTYLHFNQWTTVSRFHFPHPFVYGVLQNSDLGATVSHLVRPALWAQLTGRFHNILQCSHMLKVKICLETALENAKFQTDSKKYWGKCRREYY